MDERIRSLTDVGLALSATQEPAELSRAILTAAMKLLSCDGATLYTLNQDALRFDLVLNRSLKMEAGHSLGQALPDIPLYVEGLPNTRLVSVYTYFSQEVSNISDVYLQSDFDFTGSKLFDQRSSYHTQSLLTLPVRDARGDRLGIMQLVNRSEKGRIVPFSPHDVYLATSLASQAAIFLSHQKLALSMTRLFEAFVKMIADAIDKKSAHTGEHCRRVPILADMIAKEVNQERDGPLANVHLSRDELYELHIAALLHDCGKITTPVHIMDKTSKLEGLWDRLELILARQQLSKTDSDFLRLCNTMAIPIDDTAKKRLVQMKEAGILTDDECRALSVERGNLTPEERSIMEAHVVHTQQMLSTLPFPEHLKAVCEIASSHHERVDGTGYPHHLKGSQMSLRARILALADVFEALTAPDRPYKKPLELDEALLVLRDLVQKGKIDRDLYQLFVERRVFEKYALAVQAF